MSVSQFSFTGLPENRESRTKICYSLHEMQALFRSAARLLMLVMLAPAYQPMAMACAVPSANMHCMRRAPASGNAVQAEMPCHHALARSKPKSAPDDSALPSLQSANADDCCKQHCCCGAVTSEWAQPASRLPSFVAREIETARPAQDSTPTSSDVCRQNSARAPPRA